MKVVWSPVFLKQYSGDPAARAGRLEPVVEELQGAVEWEDADPAGAEALLRCHDRELLEAARAEGLFDVAALAAGAVVRAAELALAEPAFALVRPPGHHAGRTRAWGFCRFNNVAVALSELRARGLVREALVLDFDLHAGDGTLDVLGGEPWVRVVNPVAPSRDEYLADVVTALEHFQGDWIAVSAGFDNHSLDWGGLLHTEDYGFIGLQVGIRTLALGGHCFAALEGGYNPRSLAESVRAFVHGLERGWRKGGSGRADRS